MTRWSSPEISSPIAKPSTPQIPPPMLDEGEENTINVELDDGEDPHAASDVSSGMCCIEFKSRVISMSVDNILRGQCDVFHALLLTSI